MITDEQGLFLFLRDVNIVRRAYIKDLIPNIMR
nr:MAG TPA: hypothetical protein [Caudoviricetes sp.]